MGDTSLHERLLNCTKLEFLLLGDLRQALEESEDACDNQWLLAILDSLIRTVPVAFEMRQEGGYMTEVLAIRPTLSGIVDELRAEHDRITGMLLHLRNSVAARSRFTALADQIQAELRDWMELLTDHNRRERALFQTTMNSDMGCCD